MNSQPLFHGDPALARAIEAALAAASCRMPVLVNAEPAPEPEVVVARCRAFVECLPSGMEALIVTLLHRPAPGIADWPAQAACASLWAFSRAAALDWAPRGIRVNAIGIGVVPPDPWAGEVQATQPAFEMPCQPATAVDIAGTVVAMAAMRSMTGQIVRLGS